MTHRKNQPKTNRHAGPHDRTNGSGDPDRVGVNGHGPASTERGGIPVQRDRAASDDASGATVARAAGSATAPGTVRKAYAEAAPPHSGKKNGHLNEKKDKPKNKNGQKDGLQDFLLAGPTDFAAMQDGAAYVNSVAARVDLVGASVRLVGSEDEKIAKAELDRLRDMKFGKGPVTVIEEVPRVEIGDMPRPVR